MNTTQFYFYTVISYDESDDTYEFKNKQMNSLFNTFWAKCKTKLEVGKTYKGKCNFDVKESLKRREIPEFILSNKTNKEKRGF